MTEIKKLEIPLCKTCKKPFFNLRPKGSKGAKLKYCSDECRSIVLKKRISRQTEYNKKQFKGVHKKLDKCSTLRCNNKVSRELPDGTPVCRTCLAKHNVYGGVNKPSPTTSHPGTGFQKKGFAHKSTREENTDAKIDWDIRSVEIKRKRQKRWFAKAKEYGSKGSTNAYDDFIKDSRNETTPRK